ncbi:MAG: DUF1638 domain-containing protein [Verrucomicrobiota bacterium]
MATEIRDIARLHRLDNVTLECLPGILHNRPSEIPDAVRARLDRARGRYDRILLGYADCGTAGELADIATREGIEMLPGAHCYQFFAGQAVFDAMHDDDPTAFYLTDYLVKHFDRIILDGLGIDAHPELRDLYFGNYTKMIYLAQTDDPGLDERAQACADKIGLAFERVTTTYGDLEPAVVTISNNKERV